MPNWLFLIFLFLYDLGLAVWIGGTIVLGAAASPVLFKSLPRPQATELYVPILARFARIQVIALLMIVAGAGARFLIWERHAVSFWLIGRWSAIVMLACAVLGQMSHQRKLRVFGANLGPETEENPIRIIFEHFQIRAEGLMRASVIAAFIAVFFS